MDRRFSSEELYKLRNSISIDEIICNKLNIPSKVCEGYLRFMCPLCNEFNTATNHKTNLGRCFRCNSNFNNIDLVMIVEKLNFIEAVKFLKQFLK